MAVTPQTLIHAKFMSPAGVDQKVFTFHKRYANSETLEEVIKSASLYSPLRKKILNNIQSVSILCFEALPTREHMFSMRRVELSIDETIASVLLLRGEYEADGPLVLNIQFSA